MITLTRLTGAPFALNPDLVERVDCTPDTVITLVDGTKYLVAETLQEVTDLVLDYRSRIVAGASMLERNQQLTARRTLHAVAPVPTAEVDEDLTDDGDHQDRQDRQDHQDHRETKRDAAADVVSLEPRTI